MAGHLELDPADRDEHVRASVASVRAARLAPDCADFAVSADPLDPGRVNVFECWESDEALQAFRTRVDEPDAEPFDFARIQRFHITQYDASDRSS
ncbi:MAG: antibiotic biosynthesis monooxygenase [Actinomycetota bacterium]|nr:antibiotic biosynthesis monooxygenase [Actinomycetota bacterium]